MEGEELIEDDLLLQEERRIWKGYSEGKFGRGSPEQERNYHGFGHYADRQLQHSVLTQQFDFAKIAAILNYAFQNEGRKFTEQACQDRWAELHSLRNHTPNIKLQRMENKRAQSVSTFSNPYGLYNLDEMLHKLKEEQKNKQREDREAGGVEGGGEGNMGEGGGVNRGTGSQRRGRSQRGYNIFQDSVRREDDEQGRRQRQEEMRRALSRAQQPSQVISDKLMHFSPYWERLNGFQVRAEELTPQRLEQIMRVPIQMERVERELRTRDLNEASGGWKPKKREVSGPVAQYQIQEDWQAYESD